MRTSGGSVITHGVPCQRSGQPGAGCCESVWHSPHMHSMAAAMMAVLPTIRHVHMRTEVAWHHSKWHVYSSGPQHGALEASTANTNGNTDASPNARPPITKHLPVPDSRWHNVGMETGCGRGLNTAGESAMTVASEGAWRWQKNCTRGAGAAFGAAPQLRAGTGACAMGSKRVVA